MSASDDIDPDKVEEIDSIESINTDPDLDDIDESIDEDKVMKCSDLHY